MRSSPRDPHHDAVDSGQWLAITGLVLATAAALGTGGWLLVDQRPRRRWQPLLVLCGLGWLVAAVLLLSTVDGL
ncbi:hypothetical protein G443_002181 [Actinoalloteichus cyanogriseus DSM 43889]|uniref:DUF2530 family protein n=1 Tax=Actinoalloteichus caeruleus DSM 43889 TaxID=1120930 RepID=A0ABT1JHD2_ACTCY|nr:hypothetical protein [Actinoalloteichus caeruleus DSM 43889]